MKKSILFLVTFMLLGFSFAKAQQIQNGVYLIINEKTKKALTDEPGKVTQTTVRNGQANQEWRISDYNDGAKIISPANNNATDKDGNFRTLVKFEVSTQSNKLRVSYSRNSSVFINGGTWVFELQNNKNYCIIENKSRKFIDIPRGKSDEGIEIQVFNGNKDDNQRFELRRIR